MPGGDSPFVLGVLMLDTRFPRLPADIGNPASFDHPVLYRTLPGASVARVVTGQPLPRQILEDAIAGARALIEEGATAITTSCGFLSPLQHDLQASLPVPVITSALWMLPALREKHGPDATLGVLTFDSGRLSPHHLPDAGPLAIEGLQPGDHLFEVISRDLETLDAGAAEAGVVAAAQRLKARTPQLQAVVLECTNLAPYRRKIEKICGCEVVSILDAIKTFAIYR